MGNLRLTSLQTNIYTNGIISIELKINLSIPSQIALSLYKINASSIKLGKEHSETNIYKQKEKIPFSISFLTPKFKKFTPIINSLCSKKIIKIK